MAPHCAQCGDAPRISAVVVARGKREAVRVELCERDAIELDERRELLEGSARRILNQ